MADSKATKIEDFLDEHVPNFKTDKERSDFIASFHNAGVYVTTDLRVFSKEDVTKLSNQKVANTLLSFKLLGMLTVCSSHFYCFLL